MLNKIKSLADEAIALQNKNRMDEVLREISVLCEVKDDAGGFGDGIADTDTVKDGKKKETAKARKSIDAKGAKDAE